jgi:hypothetical protein
MPLPAFADIHAAYDQNFGYGVTNEEPEVLRDLIRREHPYPKIGAIASSGEVVLFSLLPQAESVVAVDHAYRSLAVFWLKVLLLDTHGPAGTKKILTGPYEGIVTAAENLLSRFPAELVKLVQPTVVSYDPKLQIPCLNHWTASDLRREWNLVSEEILSQAARKLGDLTLLHGDLSDLSSHGPFDVLYMSNATEHAGRSKHSPTWTSLRPLVREKGIVLRAASGIFPGSFPDAIKSVKGTRSGWTFAIHEAA